MTVLRTVRKVISPDAIRGARADVAGAARAEALEELGPVAMPDRVAVEWRAWTHSAEAEKGYPTGPLWRPGEILPVDTRYVALTVQYLGEPGPRS